MAGSPKTICVIDNDRVICDQMRLVFESRGHRCLITHDGESGLEEVRRVRPDLVVLDIQLPKMNGYHLLTELKKDEALASIPVFVLTGLTAEDRRSDEDWRRSLEVAAFLSKPFDPLVVVAKFEGMAT